MTTVRGIVASDFHLHACNREHQDASLAAGRDFARLVAKCQEEQPIELVLCGDIYDLAVGGEGPVLERLRAIAATHLEFHGALRSVIARGGRVVLVPGNHDYELATPEARAWLSEEVPGARIEAWFWRVHRVHIEHGSQYDPDNAHPHPLAPLGDPLGVLLTRQIMHRLGDLKLLDLNDRTPLVMLAHCFWKYGLRTPALVARYCYIGARAVLWPEPLPPSFHEDALARERALAEARAMARDEVRSLAAMSEAPTHLSPKSMARRMYLDRLSLGALTIIATAVTLEPFVLLGAVALGAALGMYRNLYRGKTSDRLRAAAERIARQGLATQVVFGHAHEESDDGTYLNAGSFSFPLRRSRRAFIEIDGDGARLRHMEAFGDVLPLEVTQEQAEHPLQAHEKHPLYAHARQTFARRRRHGAA